MRPCLPQILPILAACAIAAPASAQTPDRPPALVVVEEGRKPQPLGVSRVDVDVRVLGTIAETRMTLVFSNPHARALAGDLYFPLPEGATVSGYALDIGGAMVDGVVVEKDRGRQVFEKEVRKGVDPGLVEWAQGNVFKTRVFPIPPRGSRTVMVRYVSDVSFDPTGASYRLPLDFREPVKQVHVRVEVVKGAAEPRVASGGLPGLRFGAWRDSFVAEANATDAVLDQDLVVALPDVEKKPVVVEKAPDGQVYFAINDFPADPRGSAGHTDAAPKAVTIFWDASGSRAKVDHQREYAFLRAYFARMAEHPVRVSLVLFRNEMAPPVALTVERGDAGPLIAALEGAAYDGGTQVGCLAPAANDDSDLYLLFTDGLSNIGKEEPAPFGRPLYTFASGTMANAPFLQYLATRSGGQYFSLGRLTDAQVLAGMGSQAFTFLGASAEGAEAGAIYPQRALPVAGRFCVAGKLTGEKAKVTLRYGAGGKTLKEIAFTVSAADAAEGDLLRRYWAQAKVDELLIFPERNEQEIVQVGKRYGLVTPGTSLIVLERLEQYVEHEIEPPRTLPEMRNEWLRVMDERAGQKKREDQEKITHILALWRERVKWWETEWKYPKDFRYKEPKRRDGRVGSGGGGVGAAWPSAPARTQADGMMTGAAPPPPAPADGAMKAKKDGAGEDAGGGPAIVIKEWDPDTPYLRALKAAAPEKRLAVYLEQRKEYAASPAFYLDCGDTLLKMGEEALGLQVLTNIAELELENPALLRVLAHKLAQTGKLNLAIALFEKVRKMRPEEPQSHRDLALALAKRARYTGDVADYDRALDLLNHVVMNQWDRFDEIEVIALMEMNALWAEVGRKFPERAAAKPPFDSRLEKLVDLDVRITLTWDADMTDMDLHVVEPSGEHAFYGHNKTTIGGLVSKDFTRGYGPEEYILRRAMHGTYKIEVNYFGSSAATLMGPVTVQAEVITDFGRPNEKRKSLTLRLTGKKETIPVGEIEF